MLNLSRYLFDFLFLLLVNKIQSIMFPKYGKYINKLVIDKDSTLLFLIINYKRE